MTLEVFARHAFEGFRLEAEFTAPPGVTVLFGPSGCGKSTVLNVVAGLLRPQAGRVVLGSQVLLDTTVDVALPPEKRRCGVVFQDARLLPHLTVEANLRYGARRSPGGAEGPGFGDVVDLLGIERLLGRRPRSLSGGERQRVAIGRALLCRPRLLLLDEPLASLDGVRRGEILPFLAVLHRRFRVPLLYVTHALDEVDRLADTLVLLEAGRVVAAGPMEQLMARTDLELLSLRQDAGAVLSCTVAGHDEAFGLTRLEFPGGALQVPVRTDPPGSQVRVRMMARDITLATRRPEQISSRNVLQANVCDVVASGRHEALVTLALGPSRLYARLTRQAVGELGLAPGVAVFAIMKSTMLAA